MKQRFTCWILAFSLILSLVPFPALAEEKSQGICPHHTEHTAECGYAPEVAEIPCNHVCSKESGCITEVTHCIHEHGEECYSDGILPAEGEEKTADTCSHICSKDNGCITEICNCIHTHDENCGYQPGQEEKPCNFVCEVCNSEKEEHNSELQPEPDTCSHGNAADTCDLCQIEKVIESLPTEEDILALDNEGQNQVYATLQSVTDDYNLLSEEQQQGISNREKLFTLHQAFNAMTEKAPEEEQKNVWVELILDKPSGDYNLGDTVQAQAKIYGVTGEPEIRYTITRLGEDDDYWGNGSVVDTCDTTQTSYSFTPSVGGRYMFMVSIPGHTEREYFTVKDSSLMLERVFSPKTVVKVGEPIQFICQTSGSGKVKSVTYRIDSSYNVQEEIHTGTDLNYTYYPQKAGLYYTCAVTLENENGAIYKKNLSFTVTDKDSCVLTGIDLSAKTVKPGEAVTITPAVDSNQEISSIEYTIEYPIWGDGPQTITAGDLQPIVFTPPDSGEYRISVKLIDKGGLETVQYTTLYVTDSIVAFTAGFSENCINLGESVDIVFDTMGEGSIVRAEYDIQKIWDFGQPHVYYSGEDVHWTFTPESGGIYVFHRAIVYNDKGESFDIRPYTNECQLVVRQGAYISDVVCSAKRIPLGDSITFTPVIDGEGAAVKARYEIFWEGGDTYNGGYFIADSADSFTWTPPTTGQYESTVTITNDIGVSSCYKVSFEVVEETLKLDSLTLDNSETHPGSTVTAKAIFSGEGSVDSYVYTLYYKASQGAEESVVRTEPSKDTSFHFQPDRAGLYRVTLDVTTAMGNTFHEETELLHVTEELSEGTVDSTVKVTGEKPSGSNISLEGASVGGLDREEEAQKEAGKHISLTVILKYISEGFAGSSDLFEIAFTKNGESLDHTETVLEFKIPFNFSHKTDITVYRAREGSAGKLQMLSGRPDNPQNGTAYVDVKNGCIYLYTNQPSLYAIGYDTVAEVTYIDGTNILKTQDYIEGQGLSKLYKPTKSGYRFDGWYAEKELKTRVTSITKDMTGDITLYAKWRKSSLGIWDNPRTGDYIMIAVGILAVSGIGLGGLLYWSKRKKKN